MLPCDLINDRSRDMNTALLLDGLLSRDTGPVLSLVATSRDYVMREVGPNWQKMGPDCHAERWTQTTDLLYTAFAFLKVQSRFLD